MRNDELQRSSFIWCIRLTVTVSENQGVLLSQQMMDFILKTEGEQLNEICFDLVLFAFDLVWFEASKAIYAAWMRMSEHTKWKQSINQ